MPPVASSQHRVYCALPGTILPRSLLRVALTYAAAPGPVTVALPRWLTSKTPTDSRTAACSLRTPEGYSSGISQPPNSAILAPSATCRSCRGEVNRSAVGAPSPFSAGCMRPNLPQPPGVRPRASIRPGTARPVPCRPVGTTHEDRTCVTTFTLRKGSPDKTRTDVVVIGVVSTRKGLGRRPGWRGGRLGVRPQARPAAVHPRLHGQARRESRRSPPAAWSRPRC